MNNLTQRIITAIIGAAFVIAAILYSEWTFILLLSLIVVLGLLEFYGLFKSDGKSPQKLIGIVLGILPFAVPLLQSLTGIAINLLPFILILPSFIFIRELYSKHEQPFVNVAVTLLGVIYIALPFFLFYLISFQGSDNSVYHPETILGFLFILWASDTGAYFAGRFLGKHKLFERVSPKKTWEGVVGAIVLAGLTAYFTAGFATNLNLMNWMIIAGIIVLTGTLGDLVESLFKRSIKIKDSGSLLPGHGGILDRFDGLFLAAPFVFFYLMLYA